MGFESFFLLPSTPPLLWQRFSWHHLSPLMTIYLWMNLMTTRCCSVVLLDEDSATKMVIGTCIHQFVCIVYWLSNRMISPEITFWCSKTQPFGCIALSCMQIYVVFAFKAGQPSSVIVCARHFHIHFVWQLPVFIEILSSSGVTRCMAVSYA